MAKKSQPGVQVISQNRRAKFDYDIEEEFEAGLVLTGSEVKSLREGKANIAESYATEEEGEIWLINSYIPEYGSAGHFNHEPKRKRKLLLHKREMDKLAGALQRKGLTLVPMSLYFNKRGIAKLKIGLGKGKTKIDKRRDIKDKDWKREQARLLREKG